MERKTSAEGRAETGNPPRTPEPTGAERSSADDRDLDAFQVVSRRSRRAVAQMIEKLVRPA